MAGEGYMASASLVVTPQGVEAELGVGWVASSTSQMEYRPIHVQKSSRLGWTHATETDLSVIWMHYSLYTIGQWRLHME